MRWVVVLVILAACGEEPPECGTNIAEAIFTESALDAWDHAFGPPAQPSGTCPGGGTSIVEGTSAPSATSPRVDNYKVTFDNCALLDRRLTFTGTVQLTATWLGDVNASYCETCLVTSDSLVIEGTEDACDEPSVHRTCKVSFSVKGTAGNVPQRYDGSICDFIFP